MGKLNGEIALVTGHRRILEPESRFRSRREGDAVAVNYASDRAGAERAVEKIRTAGGKAIAIRSLPLQ